MRSPLLLISLFWLCGIHSVQSQDFSEGFSIQEIPDTVWLRMQGKSYHPNEIITRKDLRYLRVLHWDYDQKTHTGELVCNRIIARKLLQIFQELYQHRYPIQRMRLPDEYDADDERQMRDNNTSCFCFRRIASSKNLSYHARGLAIDINPLYNPYVKIRKNGQRIVQPSTAIPYCDRSKKFHYKINRDDICCRIFLRHGFIWGGSWKSQKDYQHFEFHPAD